jgi:hypothetical protein
MDRRGFLFARRRSDPRARIGFAGLYGVLDKLPKSVQPNAHGDLREIWLSPNRATAEAAMATFAEKYAPKYQKSRRLLAKGPRRAADVL